MVTWRSGSTAVGLSSSARSACPHPQLCSYEIESVRPGRGAQGVPRPCLVRAARDPRRPPGSTHEASERGTGVGQLSCMQKARTAPPPVSLPAGWTAWQSSWTLLFRRATLQL